MTSLPVVDISDLLADPTSARAAAIGAELCTVGHHPGFVHIIGHGVDPDLERGLLSVADEFFELPAAEREALAIANSAAFRGYTILGDERTGGKADWRDQLDYGPEQEAPAPGYDGPAWLRLRGPNQWPASLPHLRPIALGWMDAMVPVGVAILRALAQSMGQPADLFDAGFIPHHDLHTKIIRYPARPAADAEQGVGLHHDTGLLTFILQNAVAGLQVMIDEELVTVEPLPGAYVLNLGAMLQTATSGYLRATPHRVISPAQPPHRVSVALFFNPNFESTYEPFALPEELAALARPDHFDLNGDTIKTLFGENNLKARLRSHPDVAQRHYRDVVGADVAIGRNES